MKKSVLRNPAARPLALPLTPGIAVGPLVFVSGQVGVDPATGALAGPDVAAQTRQTLENIRAILRAADLGLDDVVKTTVFLTNIADSPAMNAAYAELFGEVPPTRSTVGIAALARPEFLVEIEAIAMRPGGLV
jgi:2-iminobutanoate/2-iminopropanoate deaminase